MDDNLNGEEKSNSGSGRFSERVSFIIGFSALVIALLPYKEFAQSVNIPMFNWNISLYALVGVFFAILFFSTYLYGLNYIRYRFPLILNIGWLKFIELIADILYITAFIFPLLICILVLVLYFTKTVPNLAPYITIISITISTLVGILTSYISFYTYRNKEKELIAKLSEVRLNDPEKIVESGQVRKIYILNLFESIISTLEALLVPYIGLGVQRVSRYEITKLAQNKGLISREDAAIINDLRGLRNQITHNELSTGKEVSKDLLEKSKSIFIKLSAQHLRKILDKK